MPTVRLIRRKPTGEPSITERECCEHAYGENVLGNADIVPREPAEELAEKSTEADTREWPTTDSRGERVTALSAVPERLATLGGDHGVDANRLLVFAHVSVSNHGSPGRGHGKARHS
jgi:hypothetical protein